MNRGRTLYTWNILCNNVVADDGNADDLENNKGEDYELITAIVKMMLTLTVMSLKMVEEWQ